MPPVGAVSLTRRTLYAYEWGLCAPSELQDLTVERKTSCSKGGWKEGELAGVTKTVGQLQGREGNSLLGPEFGKLAASFVSQIVMVKPENSSPI